MSKIDFAFTGKRGEVIDSLPGDDLPDSLLLVGDLIELEIETPKETGIDAIPYIKNTGKKKPLVCASSDGRLMVILSPDAVKDLPQKNPKQAKDLKQAIDLHTAFHGAEPEKIKKVMADELNCLVFLGWLNHVVYDVPKYSERRGVPFIHEAKDRGDDTPPAKEKPIICISPSRDMIIGYGPEFSFTDRGFIG